MRRRRQIKFRTSCLEPRASRLKEKIIHGKADEENGQVAVPQCVQYVVTYPFVGLGFVLVLFDDGENAVATVVGAACGR